MKNFIASIFLTLALPVQAFTLVIPDPEMQGWNTKVLTFHLNTDFCPPGAETLLDDAIELVWRETGGPRVAPPVKRGLGSRMLRAGGAFRAVDLDYAPEGLVCRLTVEREPRA